MRVPLKKYSIEAYAVVVNWLSKYYDGHVRVLASWPGGGILLVRYRNKVIDNKQGAR